MVIYWIMLILTGLALPVGLECYVNAETRRSAIFFWLVTAFMLMDLVYFGVKVYS